jgi:hypothetical protein
VYWGPLHNDKITCEIVYNQVTPPAAPELPG